LKKTANTDFENKLYCEGPKRILTIDGGGIRGIIALQFLERIETLLRKRHENSEMVLADYFDLIVGTSTGAIIAALLSRGSSISEIKQQYSELGERVFQPQRNWLGSLGRFLGVKFDSTPLSDLLKEYFKDERLDSSIFKTGLCLIAKRADTASVWPLVNIPRNKYFEYNKQIKISEILRASTAAPTYFEPETIMDVGNSESAIFIDGSVSMHQNPALQALMVANLDGFGLNWPLGENNLLLCSVGTGSWNPAPSKAEIEDANNLDWASLLIPQMIHDASELNQTIMQWLSNSHTATTIDSQIGSLNADSISPSPMLSYLRYDVMLEKTVLDELGFNYTEDELDSLRKIDSVHQLKDLENIGNKASKNSALDDHFPVIFDVK